MQVSLLPEDQELADLLADLATEGGSEEEVVVGSPKTPSRTPVTPSRSQGRGRVARRDLDEEEEEQETIEMSQVVWDVDPSTTASTEAALVAAAGEEQEEEEEDSWGDLDRTVMEDVARRLARGEEDMEDMFAPSP